MVLVVHNRDGEIFWLGQLCSATWTNRWRRVETDALPLRATCLASEDSAGVGGGGEDCVYHFRLLDHSRGVRVSPI